MGVWKYKSWFFSPACGQCLRGDTERNSSVFQYCVTSGLEVKHTEVYLPYLSCPFEIEFLRRNLTYYSKSTLGSGNHNWIFPSLIMAVPPSAITKPMVISKPDRPRIPHQHIYGDVPCAWFGKISPSLSVFLWRPRGSIWMVQRIAHS